MRKILVFIMFTAVVLLASCSLEAKYDQYVQEEKQEIINYLDNNPDLEFTLLESGLYYMDVTIGEGERPLRGDYVYVHYTGYFLNGFIFDSNVDRDSHGYPAGLGHVIDGFDEGVMLMKKGGSAKMLIPSYLGYGNTGYPMPAFTPILFDVKLDSIIPGAGK
ncbi:MAG: peptidylprolyl isomerase [Bacteroidales bacterium]|nr:peptidylprolyl isomerase [Bacteroidales bacterium]